jgi:hypothetical protein
MIDYADKDRDGGISYEEFVATVTKEYPKVWKNRGVCDSFYLVNLKYIK